MPSVQRTGPATKTWSFAKELKEISMFFVGQDDVHRTARRLVRRSERARISYAIVGAMALAAHRWRDFADVVELIRCNQLDESFALHLHPSLRPDYIECLEEKRREDEYEARNG